MPFALAHRQESQYPAVLFSFLHSCDDGSPLQTPSIFGGSARQTYLKASPAAETTNGCVPPSHASVDALAMRRLNAPPLWCFNCLMIHASILRTRTSKRSPVIVTGCVAVREGSSPGSKAWNLSLSPASLSPDMRHTATAELLSIDSLAASGQPGKPMTCIGPGWFL